MKLSTIDLRILTELQKNADQTNVALAEKVGLSAPACLKRVQKLKQNGIIERTVVLVSPDITGRRLNMIVEVEMKVDDQALSQQFLRSIDHAAEVKQCYKVTGEVDFVLVVNVGDIFEYENFCDRVLYSHANMRKFTTLISIKCTKFDLSQQVLENTK